MEQPNNEQSQSATAKNSSDKVVIEVKEEEIHFGSGTAVPATAIRNFRASSILGAISNIARTIFERY